MLIRDACALALLLSRRLVTRKWRIKCWPLVEGVFDWKAQRFCWPKGTSLECAESIYVKITKTVCVSDELCDLLKEEEVGQSVSLGDSCIKRVRDDNYSYL